MTNRVSHRSLQNKRHLSIVVTPSQLAQAKSPAVHHVTASVDALWCNKKYGYAPHEKPVYSVCIVMENINNLGLTLGNSKINAQNNLCQDFKVDMLCRCKTQVNWSMVPQSYCFHNLFGLETETRSIVAHNTNKHIHPNQFGGCAMMAFESFAPEVINSSINTTGLGRWYCFCVGSGFKKTRIVMAYQPSNLGSSSAGTTVKDQHLRYFGAFGNARSSRTIFFEQLVSQLIIWKSVDNDIVLTGDFNENVYTGCLARWLSQDNLNLTELCHQHTGIPIPPFFRNGSAPIDGIFATPGINWVNAFILPHLTRIGNYCCFIIDLTTESTIGTLPPNIVQCAARKLHCTSPWMVKVYNAELTCLCNEYNMFSHMDVIF